MFYTYVLYSFKSRQKYIGYTNNLRRRVIEHNMGIGGWYSKRNKPFKLVFYEAFLTKSDAQRQEIFYKTGYGREVLKGKIKDSLKYLIETIL